MFKKKIELKAAPMVNMAEKTKTDAFPKEHAGQLPEAPGAVNNRSILDCLIEAAPYFQSLQPIDNMIGVTDKEKFLCYVPAMDPALALGDIVGMPLPQNDAIFKAINTGKLVSISIPKEAFGVPFKSVALPVKDHNGQIVGGLGIGVSLRGQAKLMGLAEVVASSTEKTSATIQEMSSTTENLAQKQNELLTMSNLMLAHIKKTSSILDFINEVASTSNLLGLNAAIEAARAGEHGRGFSVVAEQIRKMSNNSAKSVQEIKEILNQIDQLIKTMSDKVTDVAAVGQQLSASTQQISSAVQNLASIASELEKLAELI